MKTVVAHPATIKRNCAVDLLRVLACFGVVAIHVHNSTPATENMGRIFSYFCVPYFYVTALAYFAGSLRKNFTINSVLSKIIKRIGIPFIAWSIIYAGLIFVKSYLRHSPSSVNIFRIFLYGESAEHLYYLPELIVMEMLILSAYLLVVVKKSIAGALIGLGAVAYLVWGSWNHYYGVTNSKNIIVYIAAAFFAVPKIYAMRRNYLELLVGFLLILFSLSSDYVNYSVVIKNYLTSLPLAGIGAFLVALNLPAIKIPHWVSVVALATYGIYLSHVLLVEAFETGVEILQYKFEYNLVNKLALTLSIFILCLAFVFIARKIKYARILLLGED